MITYNGVEKGKEDDAEKNARNAVTDTDMDAVFRALAHSVRRAILDYLRDSPGLSVGELARNFDISRIAVMNHLAVLEKAELIVSEKDGRTRKLYLNVMPIQTIHERWTDTYSAHWAERVNLIKDAAEAAVKKLTQGDPVEPTEIRKS